MNKLARGLQNLFKHSLLGCALFLFLAGPVCAFTLPFTVKLTAADVQANGAVIKDLKLQTVNAGFRLEAAQMNLPDSPDYSVSGLQLDCADTGDLADHICPGGVWEFHLHSAADGFQEKLQGEWSGLKWTFDGWLFTTSITVGEFKSGLSAKNGAKALDLKLDWQEQTFESLPFSAMWPEVFSWVKAGVSSGEISYPLQAETNSAAPSANLPVLNFNILIQDLGLDSPSGVYAAEGVKLKVSGTLKAAEAVLVDAQLRLLDGEVLLDSFYAAFGPNTLNIRATAALSGKNFEIKMLEVEDDESLDLKAALSFSADDPLSTLKYRVQQLNMQFPLAYQRYLDPVLAEWTLDKLNTSGTLSWSGTGEGNDFPQGTLLLQDLSVVDGQRARFAFTGMNAQIEAGQSVAQSSFTWQGLLLGKISLGAGKVGLNTRPGVFELASPLRLNVLGGEIVIDEFGLVLPSQNVGSAEPEVTFQAAINTLDMKQLTAALQWPEFAGEISGRIPGVSYSSGVLSVDGQLGFEAFDGEIILSDLRVERLFGVLPSLAANLDVKDLDLQLLTSAFSFGRIAGRIDGYVHELRMLDWSPVSFDAWVGTPERQSESKKISRQAVNHLTSIGGGGATAALTGPLMRVFNNFSYRKLGMGCRLENYVCEIRGLADDDASVLIMEGSGVPNLSIRVFNRRMDWPQLVSNLEAVSAGESVRIGDP